MAAPTPHPHVPHCHMLRKGAKRRGDKSVPLPNGRTLFVVNIPPDATERELTLFFNTCGTVEYIIINQDAQLFEGAHRGQRR